MSVGQNPAIVGQAIVGTAVLGSVASTVTTDRRLDWSKGFSVAYYATIVDAATWLDSERIELIQGKVNRSDSDLQESAQLTCKPLSDETWIRINMDVSQEGASDHVPLFTGLAICPDREIDGAHETGSVVCYSVLKPAQDVLLPRGWYAPKGREGAELVEELLSVSPAPKSVYGGSPRLSANIVAEAGESCLTMARKILTAINWRLRLLGDGTIEICPQAENVSVMFSTADNDSIEPKVKVSFDWFDTPNVYRAVSGNTCAEVRDAAAIRARGREIWVEDRSPAFNGSESIAMYARRKLDESQWAAYKVSYDRRYHPDVLVGDLIELHYPAQKIDNIFMVSSQAVDLVAGGRTSEEVVRYEQSV